MIKGKGGSATSGFGTGITLRGFVLSFLAHKIGERLFVFTVTTGVSDFLNHSRRRLMIFLNRLLFWNSSYGSYLQSPVRRLLWHFLVSTSWASVPCSCTYLPASHPTEDADVVAISYRFRGQLWRSIWPFLDWNSCPKSRNIRLASDLHCFVRGHGWSLMAAACTGEEVGMNVVSSARENQYV